MYSSTTHKDFNLFIKQLLDEDMIWVLHVMNKEHEEQHARRDINDRDTDLVQLDIQKLNTINNTDEIRNKVIGIYKDINERDTYYLIDKLKNFQDTLLIRGRSLNEYKNNKRLLYFALNYISTNDRQYKAFKDIHNEYFRFLYTIFMLPSYYKSNRSLDNIESSFSTILSKKPLHFKNFDSDDFYLWAKSYMDQDRENARVHNSKNYNPMNPEEYRIVINAIFDDLLDKDTNIYKAIKDKISNAWHQKAFREKNKGRKHHYHLTDKTLQCLEILAKKRKMTKEKMIDELINERYTKECMSQDGSHLYTI